jgi:lipopolysaccharide export system protein LptA
MFHFKDSVRIVNPDYVMTGDTMDYNTETETAFFTGPSKVKGDSINIFCLRGWYDTKNDLMRLWKDAMIDNKQQIIKGDSLYYESKTGFGQAFRNISIADTSNDVMVRVSTHGIIKILKNLSLQIRPCLSRHLKMIPSFFTQIQ